MPLLKKQTQAEAEETIRRKLVQNEMNPLMDAILTVFLMCLSPFIALFAQLHDKIMFKFLNRTWIYNVSWEDPRMDQRVFDLGEQDHIVTIASAGCNVLDYIIEGAEVTAVDFNLCQINLTELKKVAILNIEFEQFFEIFSMSNMDLLRELYPTKMRPYLSESSVDFWDEGIHTVKSFMYSGTSGSMSYYVFKWLFPMFGLGFVAREISRGISHKELLAMISEKEYAIRSVAWIMDNVLLRGGCCLAGVPERQMNLGLHRPNNLAMVIERVFFQTDLVNDNYFYTGYLLGYYPKNNCPRYLEEKNYLTMRKYLKQDKLHLVHGTILDAIDNVKTPITVASLLDHMDWMPDRLINEEITHLMAKMDPVRGKIFWRTFADDVHSAPLKWLQGVPVDDYDDRVGMYWTTWIAHIKDCPVAYEERVTTSQDKGLLFNMWTGAKIITAPFWKPIVASSMSFTGHQLSIESFYKFQKEGYDTFREGLLHAKPELIEAIPLDKAGNMTWVDIGGGTARNLEYFTPETIRKYFKQVVVVDISPSLLEVAQERIERMGLSDIVTCVLADVTDATMLKKLPKSANLVTMSYAFSMIPDQKGATKNISKLLSKGGHLLMADFFQKGNHDDVLPFLNRTIRRAEASFHKLWFKQDGVHLLADETVELDNNLEKVWDSRFRGAIPFLPFMRPYHGVLVYKKY